MPGPPPIDRQQLGAAAEDAALAHLLEQGLGLIARNVRYPFGEIDLIALDAGSVVFVEVRFRRNNRFGGAAVSVDAGKRRKIARAAQAWLNSHRQYSTAACRFDVVAVTPAGDGQHCEWIRSAFTLDDLY